MVFVNNLKKIRVENQKTRREVANMLEITETQLFKLERGDYFLSEKHIRKICEAFKVSADYLLALEEK